MLYYRGTREKRTEVRATPIIPQLSSGAQRPPLTPLVYESTIEGRVDITFPQDVNMTELVTRIAHSLHISTSEIEILRTQRGSATVDFRLRSPTLRVKTSGELAQALAQDTRLHEALSQSILYVRESCLSFSVHSHLSQEESVCLQRKGVFRLLDQIAVSHAKAMRVNNNNLRMIPEGMSVIETNKSLRHEMVQLLWPELLQDHQLLLELREELRNITLERDMLRDKLTTAEAERHTLAEVNDLRLTSLLLKESETSRRQNAELTQKFQKEEEHARSVNDQLTAKNAELTQMLHKEAEHARSLHDQLTAKNTELTQMLLKDEEHARSVNDQLTAKNAELTLKLQKEAEHARNLHDQLTAKNAELTQMLHREEEHARSVHDQLTAKNAELTQKLHKEEEHARNLHDQLTGILRAQSPPPRTDSPETLSDLVPDLQAQIVILQATLMGRQQEVQESREDARCFKDALAELESELKRLREENRTLQQKAAAGVSVI